MRGKGSHVYNSLDEDEVQRLIGNIASWFYDHTGFQARDNESNVLSAYYGGNWIQWDAEKLARAILATRPPAGVAEELRAIVEQVGEAMMTVRQGAWRSVVPPANGIILADEGWNALLDLDRRAHRALASGDRP